MKIGYYVLKRRVPIIHWRRVTSQKNVDLKMNVV